MRATLLAIREELKRRRHEPIRVQGQWLTWVVSGYFNYHAVPGNLIRLGGFRLAVCRLWRQALKRRSQRNRLQWPRYGRLADLYIPRPRNTHPYPEDRFASRTQGRSRMRSSARTDLLVWTPPSTNQWLQRAIVEGLQKPQTKRSIWHENYDRWYRLGEKCISGARC